MNGSKKRSIFTPVSVEEMKREGTVREIKSPCFINHSCGPNFQFKEISCSTNELYESCDEGEFTIDGDKTSYAIRCGKVIETCGVPIIPGSGSGTGGSGTGGSGTGGSGTGGSGTGGSGTGGSGTGGSGTGGSGTGGSGTGGSGTGGSGTGGSGTGGSGTGGSGTGGSGTGGSDTGGSGTGRFGRGADGFLWL